MAGGCQGGWALPRVVWYIFTDKYCCVYCMGGVTLLRMRGVSSCLVLDSVSCRLSCDSQSRFGRYFCCSRLVNRPIVPSFVSPIMSESESVDTVAAGSAQATLSPRQVNREVVKNTLLEILNEIPAFRALRDSDASSASARDLASTGTASGIGLAGGELR